MDKILKDNRFKHIESENYNGMHKRTYRKFRKGSKYIVKIFPETDRYQIVSMDNVVSSGTSKELLPAIRSLKLNK